MSPVRSSGVCVRAVLVFGVQAGSLVLLSFQTSFQLIAGQVRVFEAFVLRAP